MKKLLLKNVIPNLFLPVVSFLLYVHIRKVIKLVFKVSLNIEAENFDIFLRKINYSPIPPKNPALRLNSYA